MQTLTDGAIESQISYCEPPSVTFAHLKV